MFPDLAHPNGEGRRVACQPGEMSFLCRRFCNLYVCVEGSLSLRNLTVRDLLRADGALREEYGVIKMNLARKEWDNVNAYSVGKNRDCEQAFGTR